MRRGRVVLTALVVAGVLAACGTDDGPGVQGAADADRGETLFNNNCAACHGPGGQGTTDGPPLVHVIYEPGHHSDEAFQIAVARGVPAHHWDFGDMPPVAGLSREEVADIIEYVRDLQRDAGIID